MPDLLERFTTELADQYRIERELGSGGMATVYLAHDLKHDRQVAIKVLRPELSAALGAERFLREIEIAAGLSHPHILPLHDSGEAGGFLYYVMPYVAGESLRDRIEREKQLPLDDSLQIACEIADALGYAHSHGIVHRDIKPENVLLGSDHALVADFGIARAISDVGGEHLTETGISIGTPAYMSPEQASGEDLDGRSDVYSLGCVLYEMLAGEPPYTGVTPLAILAKKSADAIPRIKVVRETVPDTIEAAITKTLAKVPADRFASTGKFVEALERAGTQESTALPTQAVVGSRWWIVAMATAMIALALGGSWAVSMRSDASIERIAVLPPIDFASTADQEPIVHGIYNALLTELGQVGVPVIGGSRTMMRYQSTDKTLREIAEELSVDALIEASVFWVGDSIDIGVRLIDGRTEESLWSRSYNADSRNLQVLLRQVTRAIAGQIRLALTPVAERHLASSREVNREAHEAYLKGRYYSIRTQEEGAIATAIRYYEEAIAIDSTFAGAYAALAQVLVDIPVLDFERAAVVAQTALDLDPVLPEAHVALGIARMMEWDWSGAEAAFRRAIDLNSGSSEAHNMYAHFLRQHERFDEALSEARRAAELDPFIFEYRWLVGWVLVNQRRYGEAIEVWDQVLNLDPEYGPAIQAKGMVYAMQGNGEAVISSARRAGAAQRNVAQQATSGLLGLGYALSGQSDRAEEILRDLEARDGTPNFLYIAALHHTLGNDDTALDWLEEAYDTGYAWLPNVTAAPWFDDLRDHPRFRELRSKMGLP
jgi:serine/threonine-protein kinase